MYCKWCGKYVPEGKKECPYCGRSEFTRCAPMEGYSNDSESFGYAFLCFLIPILGLVLYLVWKDQYPMRASSCGKGALWSVVLSIISVVFTVSCISCTMCVL